MKKTVSLLIIISTAALAGFLLGRYLPGKRLINGHTVRQSGYKLINPLLECEIFNENNSEIRPFRDKVQNVVDEEIESGNASHISLYFRDLNNGPWMGINEKEEFSPSSLLKVPLLMSFFEAAENDPSLLKKEIKFDIEEDKSGEQNLKPGQTLEKGKSYTVEELLKRMIFYSDNNASSLLLKNLDISHIIRPYEELSLSPPILGKEEYSIRVKDYATFFRMLFNSSYLNNEMSEKALEILLESEFNNGIVAGLPKEVLIAHKFGERGWINSSEIQLHDCGIVYYPGNPYLLCIMTRGKDFIKLEKVISNLSELVYNEVHYQKAKK